MARKTQLSDPSAASIGGYHLSSENVLLPRAARDAPVRYFLNVLEADRARFSDLKQVYALAAYEINPEEATSSWGTLAVIPLPYCKINSDTNKQDHTPLWRDLETLSEVAERPKHYRQKRAREILERPVTETNDVSRRELGWLIGGRHDLWARGAPINYRSCVV